MPYRTITRDQYTKDYYTLNSTAQTISVTVGTGATALVVLSVNENLRTYTSITANGTPMSELFDVEFLPGVSHHRGAIYTLESPPTGTYNIVVTVSGNTNSMLTWVYSLKGTKTTDFIDGYGYNASGNVSSLSLSSPDCIYPRSTWWIGMGMSSNAFTYPYSGQATEVDSINTGYKSVLFDTSAAGQIPSWWDAGINFTTDTDKGTAILMGIGISGILSSPMPTSIY